MNILYFEPNYTADANQSYTYYSSLVNAIGKKSKLTIINGRGFRVKLEDVLAKMPERPDLICFGFGWMNVWKGGVYYRETVLEGLETTKIPTAIILNKEYGGSLPSKLGWIKENNINVAFTYHHDYDSFSESTGVPFHHLPFAANPAIFKDYGIEQEYDIGFTGGLGHTFTNGWEKTSKFGMVNPVKPEGQGWSHTLRKQVKDECGSWEDINFYFSNHHHDDINAYAKRLNIAKQWLSTTGPVDIVGTRYFEVPLTNTTLLVCNRSTKMWGFDHNCNRVDKDIDVYAGLFEEDKHYVAFETPGELLEKVRYYKENETERMKIVNQAYDNAIENHTWDARADKFMNVVRSI